MEIVSPGWLPSSKNYIRRLDTRRLRLHDIVVVTRCMFFVRLGSEIYARIILLTELHFFSEQVEKKIWLIVVCH